jgi:hypothetical protein
LGPDLSNRGELLCQLWAKFRRRAQSLDPEGPNPTDFEPFQIVSTDVLFHKRGFEGETRLSNVRIAFARLNNGLTLVEIYVSRYCFTMCLFHDLFVYDKL